MARGGIEPPTQGGARREELANQRWVDVDFRWNSLKLNDKVEEFRTVPLTPYVSLLLTELKHQNETLPYVRRLRTLAARAEEWQPSTWVFRSDRSASGRITDSSGAHRAACAVAGLELTLHGLRRSFATLSEWTETPAGISAQIQGPAPQGVREQSYIRRPGPIKSIAREARRVDARAGGDYFCIVRADCSTGTNKVI